MHTRYLSLILLGLLIAGPAAAQTSGASDLRQYRLSGVLTSDTRRIALLNDRTVREGARIGDVLIESIDRREIQIRRGSTRQFVRIGGSFTATQTADSDRQHLVVTRSTPDNRPLARPIDPDLEHVVMSGETLSDIALRYKDEETTMEQMMLALFNDNRHAFGRNLNRLNAGATLKIPDQRSVDSLSPTLAASAVLEQNDRGVPPAEQAVSDVSAASTATVNPAPTASDTYGPVKPGDTLLEIARSIELADDSLTTDQVMIALFAANPHAFGNNINVLYAGSELILPKQSAVASVLPAVATAEVRRQAEDWRDSAKQSQAKVAPPKVVTVVSAENLSRGWSSVWQDQSVVVGPLSTGNGHEGNK